MRCLPDGNIEFLGRLDHQVKLRGYPHRARRDRGRAARRGRVREALVVLREDAPGEQRLVAYVVAGAEAPDRGRPARAAQAKLPEYMVPAGVRLAARAAAHAQRQDRPRGPAAAAKRARREQADAAAPHNNIELHLTKIWEDLLKSDRIGVRDNFFDVGGHSLLAVQLMDRIEKAFHRRLPLDTLWFRGGTIEALARILRDESDPGQSRNSSP